MSRLVSRILLSIFMFPLAGMLFILVMVVSEQTLRGSRNYRSEEITMFLAADLVTWAFVAIYWCMLWRAGVIWNSFRIGGTIIAAIGAVCFGALAGLVASSLIGSDGASFGLFIGGVLSIVLWLIATVLLWRETAAERAEQVRASGKSNITCPVCGYNLTGLSESRCPECGAKFTLDELMAKQPTVERDIE